MYVFINVLCLQLCTCTCNKSQFSNAFSMHRIRTCSTLALINETPGVDVILEVIRSDRKCDLCTVLIPQCLVCLKTDFCFQLVNLFSDDL